MVFNMWSWTPEPSSTKSKDDAELGECYYCNEEIIRNDELSGTWESESLVGYCPNAKDHKHKPKVGK